MFPLYLTRISRIIIRVTLYYTYRTNPGVLDARGVGNSSTTTPSCKLLCFNGGGYPKDKISLEMDSVTKELRNQYDAVIGKHVQMRAQMLHSLSCAHCKCVTFTCLLLQSRSAKISLRKINEFLSATPVASLDPYDPSIVVWRDAASSYSIIIVLSLAPPLGYTTIFISFYFLFSS